MEGAMLQRILRWLEPAFAPTMELLGSLPPRAVNRMFAPF